MSENQVTPEVEQQITATEDVPLADEPEVEDNDQRAIEIEYYK